MSPLPRFLRLLGALLAANLALLAAALGIGGALPDEGELTLAAGSSCCRDILRLPNSGRANTKKTRFYSIG